MEFSIKKVIDVKTNGFSHVRIKLKKAKGYKDNLPKEIDLFGVFNNVFEGDIYSADVKFRESEIFGYSLKAVNIPTLIIPNTAKELIKFIRSRCKGVGEPLIKTAIENIGIDIISKVADDPDILNEIPAFTKLKKEKFIAFCENNTYFEELIVFMQTLKIPAKIATKIYNSFGKTSIHHIKSNPYFLFMSGDLNFETVDKIAKEYGEIKWNDDRRIRAAVLAYVDEFCQRSGNVCLEYDEVVKNTNRFVFLRSKFNIGDLGSNNEPLTKEGFKEEDIKRAIIALISKRFLVQYDFNNETYLFKNNYFKTEKELAFQIKKRMKGTPSTAVLKRDVVSYLKDSELSDEQLSAVVEALRNRLSVLTGGPGTGKTYTINMIIKTLKHFHPEANIVLMAPTGRAATKIKEVSSVEAYTIHKALYLLPDDIDSFNDDFILACDYVVMDEASMCDEWLFDMFFKRIDPKASILIVGDSDQLPSVNPGNVLGDMIGCGLIKVSSLTKIYRQEGTSKIVLNAHAIKRDEMDSFVAEENDEEFKWIDAKAESEIAELVLREFEKAVKKSQSVSDVIVLAPLKAGVIGVNEINSMIQNAINHNEKFYKRDVRLFKVGDRILQTINNKDLNVTNGALGTITDISESPLKITVKMDGIDEEIVYTNGNIKELELGYCITVHKSQGSEIPTVIMPFHPTQRGMLNKRLIYTAITRAKKSFIGIGVKDALLNGIKKSEIKGRLSMLKNMLVNG